VNGLADLLNYVVSTLQTSALCRSVRIVETFRFSESQFGLKVHAHLTSGDVLQVRLYRNGNHTDYAYQLFQGHTPAMRWDNKEHFPSLSSFPHHFHNPSGLVEVSPLTGDPTRDVPFLMEYLESKVSR
jgi:hypothetical protein